MATQNQITPRAYLHLDSHARKSDGKSKFSIRVDIGGIKKTYRMDLNGDKPVSMKKKYWVNVYDPEEGKATREKQILHVKGNGDSRTVERRVNSALAEMEELIRELGKANKTITHNVLDRLWQRKGVKVFSQWAAKWKDQHVVQKGLKEKTGARYKVIIDLIATYEQFVGAVPVQAITMDWLKEFQEWIVRPKVQNRHGKYEGGGYSLVSGSNTVRKVGTILKYAYLDGEIAVNPFKEFVDRKLYKRIESEIIRFLEEDEIDRMYTAYMNKELLSYSTQTKNGHIRMEGEKLHHRLGIYLFTIFTGLRYSDVCKVASGHPDVSIGKTHLSVIMEKSKREGREGKMVRLKITDKLRTVCNLSGEGPVFSTPMLSSQHINSNLRKITQLLGITKYLTFHDLRRSFATSLLSKGARMKMVSTLIGHESITTTEKHYAKVVNKSADDTMELWDQLKTSFTDPIVKSFVEDVFVMLQDNPDAKVRKRLLDKIESLSDLLQLTDLETLDKEIKVVA